MSQWAVACRGGVTADGGGGRGDGSDVEVVSAFLSALHVIKWGGEDEGGEDEDEGAADASGETDAGGNAFLSS